MSHEVGPVGFSIGNRPLSGRGGATFGGMAGANSGTRKGLRGVCRLRKVDKLVLGDNSDVKALLIRSLLDPDRCVSGRVRVEMGHQGGSEVTSTSRCFKILPSRRSTSISTRSSHQVDFDLTLCGSVSDPGISSKVSPCTIS